KEIRNTCTYCSVGCGLLMYSLGDGAKNAKEAIYHIEGDPDHPAPLGLMGFGMTTILLNLANSGLFAFDVAILAMGIFYGGIA
ncbi:acetate uptake transporter, partial [Klebsiella michiganensis]|uniref:acetate uptake transporter n=1 Tax=Klebsiella michiganensis TaxID=1134687 RepID=UPI001E3E9F36